MFSRQSNFVLLLNGMGLKNLLHGYFFDSAFLLSAKFLTLSLWTNEPSRAVYQI